MAINTTRWSPDTCTCVLEYSWDNSLPNDQIVISPSSVIATCAAHASLASNVTNHFNTIMDENPRKNIVLQNILDNGPAALSDLSGTNKVLKAGITYNFSYSGTAPNRVLTVSFSGITLTQAQKNSLQTSVNNKVGTGKVVIA